MPDFPTSTIYPSSIVTVTEADITASQAAQTEQDNAERSFRSNIPYWNNFYIVTMDLNDDEKIASPDTGLIGSNFLIPFQTMPDKITDSKNANYADTDYILGSAPIKSYQNSSARTIGFTLEFFAHPEAANDYSTEDIKRVVDQSRSLLYPNYNGKDQIKPPTRCIVRLGAQASMVGVCKSVNILYDGNKPWELGLTALPHSVSITYLFEELVEIPQSYQEITKDSVPMVSSHDSTKKTGTSSITPMASSHSSNDKLTNVMEWLPHNTPPINEEHFNKTHFGPANTGGASISW